MVQMNLFPGRKQRCTHTLVDMEDGGWNREIGTDIYMTMCKLESLREAAVPHRELTSVTTWRTGMGKGSGCVYTHSRSTLLYGKANTTLQCHKENNL